MANTQDELPVETTEPAQEEQTWENSDSSTSESADNSNAQPKAEPAVQQPPKDKYVSKKDYREIAEKALKQAEWLRSVGDKRDAEYRNQLKEMAPLIELWKKAEQEKKNAELAKLSTENPAEYQKKLIEEAKSQIAQQMQPQQQQQVDPVAAQQKAVEYTNYMKTTYGEEVYKVAEPIMGQILENTRNNVGENEARILASNPDALMKIAVGEMYLQQYKNLQASNQQGQRNQAKAVQFAKGTAKPNAPAQRSTDYDNMSDADLKKAAYAEIARKFNS